MRFSFVAVFGDAPTLIIDAQILIPNDYEIGCFSDPSYPIYCGLFIARNRQWQWNIRACG
jgi:hypothetical protein